FYEPLGVIPMFSSSRRAFLGASLAGLTSARVLGADSSDEPLLKVRDDAPFQPNTLFLTWQRDPTTTMTVQWIGTSGETADTKIYYRPTVPKFSTPHAAAAGVAPAVAAPLWYVQPTTARPSPTTDFKVFRAELAGP